jgi:hypothetical protein
MRSIGGGSIDPRGSAQGEARRDSLGSCAASSRAGKRVARLSETAPEYARAGARHRSGAAEIQMPHRLSRVEHPDHRPVVARQREKRRRARTTRVRRYYAAWLPQGTTTSSCDRDGRQQAPEQFRPPRLVAQQRCPRRPAEHGELLGGGRPIRRVPSAGAGRLRPTLPPALLIRTSTRSGRFLARRERGAPLGGGIERVPRECGVGRVRHANTGGQPLPAVRIGRRAIRPRMDERQLRRVVQRAAPGPSALLLPGPACTTMRSPLREGRRAVTHDRPARPVSGRAPCHAAVVLAALHWYKTESGRTAPTTRLAVTQAGFSQGAHGAERRPPRFSRSPPGGCRSSGSE